MIVESSECTVAELDEFLARLPGQPFFVLPQLMDFAPLNEAISLGLARRTAPQIGDTEIPKTHDPRWWWTYVRTKAGDRWLESKS